MRRRLSRAAKKKPHPKTKLGLPDLDQAKAAVLGSLHSPESQRGYQHSINECEMEQIQFLLGHVSVQTTEKYLGCKQRLRGAVNDRIGIEPAQ